MVSLLHQITFSHHTQLLMTPCIEVARAAMNDAIGLPLDSVHSLTTPLAPLPVAPTELSGYEKNAVDGGRKRAKPGLPRRSQWFRRLMLAATICRK